MALTLLLCAFAAGQTYTISTFAGNGLPPTPMQARSATVRPASVCVDRAGNLYFSSDHTVFKVDGSGTLTRVAGSPGGGRLGDGGPAVDARLDSPDGVAVDAAGNIYVADAYSVRVRRVTPRGEITTVAGNGTMGFSGDGGPATRAKLSFPSSVAVDANGNLYISDSANNRVRKVTSDGTISTVAGNGKAGFSGDGGPATHGQLNSPGGIALDSAGNLYIADERNQRIRKVTPDGTISTVAGDGKAGYSGDGGPAIRARLDLPWGITMDSRGNLYIADSGNRRIRQINRDGIITRISGNGSPDYSGDGGPAINAQISNAFGVAVDLQGRLYIADGNRLRMVDRSGTISTVAGNGKFGFWGDGGPATDAQLNGPWALAIDSTGSLYFSDFFNNRVRKIVPGGTISTVAGNGTHKYGVESGAATNTSLPGPWGVAVDSAGNLYIADSANSCIRKVTPNGTISKFVDQAGNGLAADSRGNLFIAERNRVVKIAPDRSVSTVAGTGIAGWSGDGGPAVKAELNQPWGIALDSKGDLYIADSLNNCIREVNRNGVISTVAGGGKTRKWTGGIPATDAQLVGPQGVAPDSDGNLFITDANHGVVRRAARDGTISVVAGDGTWGYSGDGGPATKAQLNNPGGIAVSRDGKIYVADYLNNCIRVLTPVKR